MIRLRDILLDILLEAESEASKEAKKLGLTYYGFGRYGKNGVITHESENGKLVAKSQQSEPSKSPEISTSQQSEPSKSPEISATSIGRVRYHNTEGMDALISSVDSTLSDDFRITDLGNTLLGVTKHFGRDTTPKIQVGGEGLKMSQEYFGLHSAPKAVYNYHADTIELGVELPDITAVPIPEWTSAHTEAFELYVHETLHSTSPRINANNQFYTTGIGVSIEEGMTEFLAQEITSRTVDEYLRTHKHVDVNRAWSYEHYVTGVELMAQHGGLNVNKTFREPNGDNVRTIFYDAQFRTIYTMFEKLNLNDPALYTQVTEYVQSQWYDNDSVALMEPNVSETLIYYLEEFDKGTPVDTQDVVKSMRKLFNKES